MHTVGTMDRETPTEGLAHSTGFQFNDPAFAGTPWTIVGNPADTDDTEMTERLSLDVPVRVVDFIERYSAYRNALAKVQAKAQGAPKTRKLGRQWSRKSMAESFIATQYNAMQQQLSDLISACGEIPDADDERALEAYAAKVVAWTAKQKK
jgi:hypothetical protein